MMRAVATEGKQPRGVTSQLRTFVAVAEALSFTRAAEALGVTQQSASKAVRALEDELGVVLLERSTREVRLTAAGAALLEEATDLLARMDAAFARVRGVGAGVVGTVRVGLTPAIGPGDRADVVAALRGAGGGVGVAFRDVRPAELARALRAGEVDVALSRARGLDEAAISAAALRGTPVVLCVGAGHPLAAASSPATLATLDGERLLVPSAPETPYSRLVVGLVAEAGATVEPVEARVTGGPEILVELAAAGAVALMPEGTPVPAGVVVVPLADRPTLPLYVLWAAGRAAPAAERLRAALTPVA